MSLLWAFFDSRQASPKASFPICRSALISLIQMRNILTKSKVTAPQRYYYGYLQHSMLFLRAPKGISRNLSPIYAMPNRCYMVNNASNGDCRCKDREIVIPIRRVQRNHSKSNEISLKSDGSEGNAADSSKGPDSVGDDTMKYSNNNNNSDQFIGASHDDAINPWATMKTCIQYIWPDKSSIPKRVVFAMSLLVLSKVINVQVPLYFKAVVDSLSTSGDMVAMVPVAMIVSYGVARSTAALFQELRSVIFAPVTQGAVRQLSTRAFLHLHSMDLQWHLSRQIGGLSRAIDRGMRGINQVLNSVLFTLMPTLLEIVFVAGLLGFKFGPAYVGLTVGAVLVYTFVTYVMTKWRTKFRIEMNRLDVEAANMALDSLMNYETVKYFGNEKLEAERYGHELNLHNIAQQKTVNSLAVLNFTQNVIFSCALVTGMLMAANGATSGMMTVGDVVLINGLLLQLAFPLNFLGSTYRETRQALVDMSAMLKFLKLQPNIVDRPGAQPLQVTDSANISFDNVSFGYDDNINILDRVSFTVPAKKKVAIVGLSGSGKSTMLRLLFRFYDVNLGSIKINGQDIRDVTLSSLRQVIGVVPQDLVLFNDTIYYNIQYGRRTATRQEIEHVAKLANIHSSIIKMPHGYDTHVGERGLKLSGGEKQRICLARSLLKNPRIMILDEATSALDMESEDVVHEAIDNIVRDGRTALIISHRLKTVYNADRILVLEGGQIVEQGTHAELLANNRQYARLVEKQNILPSPVQ